MSLKQEGALDLEKITKKVRDLLKRQPQKVNISLSDEGGSAVDAGIISTKEVEQGVDELLK